MALSSLFPSSKPTELRKAPRKEDVFVSFRPTELDIVKQQTGLSEPEIRKIFGAPKKGLNQVLNTLATFADPALIPFKALQIIKDIAIRRGAGWEKAAIPKAIFKSITEFP